MKYSVILPVFNECGNVETLIREITEVLSLATGAYEIIAVDDASTDGSGDELRKIAATRPQLRVFHHRTNCGQSAALVSGFRHAAGDIIITLDADGQNNPADIPKLLKALAEGIDAVCGIRQGRQDTPIRKISSTIANRFRNVFTGDSIQDAGCTFRAMRRECLADLPTFNGLHRFLPTLLRYQGYRVIEIPVSHRPRTWGTSKYGIGNRLWRGLVDCLAMRWWRKRALPGRRLTDV